MYIVKGIKSKIMRWAGHVARMEEGKSKGRRSLGRLGVDEGTILKWTLKN